LWSRTISRTFSADIGMPLGDGLNPFSKADAN
jgi:hypothetical protein